MANNMRNVRNTTEDRVLVYLVDEDGEEHLLEEVGKYGKRDNCDLEATKGHVYRFMTEDDKQLYWEYAAPKPGDTSTKSDYPVPDTITETISIIIIQKGQLVEYMPVECTSFYVRCMC